MIIKDIVVIPLTLPYEPALEKHLARSALRNFKNRMSLYRLELSDGTVGYGDAMGEPQEVAQFIGMNALAGLKQIRHAGVQMACYDAVGKAQDLPAHILMGRQVRQRVPFAYWSIDLPPQVWAEQAALAAASGYRVYKFKCRPWWDPLEQIEQVSAIVPKGFTFWLDFNGHLRNEGQAVPILKALSRYDCVGGFESPIPQRDIGGYKALRQKIDRPIAAHYGSGCCHVKSEPFDRGVAGNIQVAERLCDALVLGAGDVEQVRHQATAADEAKLPFWIQTIGSGLRAAWIAHLASTCKQATLSSLAAHKIWKKDITALPDPLAGWLEVPEGPGLGVEVDEAVVAEWHDLAPVEPKRIISIVVYADGSRWHFSSDTQCQESFYFGSTPGFVPGVRMETREEDGSADFDDLFKRCSQTPVLTKD